MDKLPDYLIENYIIPYLTSDELFYKFRPLSSYYYHCARVKILIKFPEEIMKTLKKILEYNMREDPTNAFQEFFQRSIEQKRLILILTVQANPSIVINHILSNLRDERALRLIAFFYVLIKDEEMQNLIRQEKYDEIQQISLNQETINKINDKIKDSLNDDDLDFDINDYNLVYSSLDEEFLRNNEHTVNLFNFVTLLLNMFLTKIGFNNAKNKLNNIELVADTQILTKDAKNMIKLFKKYEIETDLDDFNYEKEELTEFNMNKNYNSDNVYDKIKSNRKKLNLTILRLHQIFSFFIKSIYIEKNDKEKINNLYIDIFEIKKFKVGKFILPIEEFLYILSMIKKKFIINEATFLLTRNYLYHHIYHEIYKINPPVIIDESQQNEKKDEKEGNENMNSIKYISSLNEEIGDGINNFDSVLESTENAGKEINESFIQFSQSLENYSNRLHEQINNSNY